jgi:hypothetical protein
MRLNREQFTNEEALTRVGAMLDEAWSENASVYLISPGNNSRGDYEKLAQEKGSRVVAARSIFSGWLQVISFIMPGSYVGAIEMKKTDSWAAAVLELAQHGYVLLVSGKGSAIESAVVEAVHDRSFSRQLPQSAEKLAANYKLSIVNAENPNCVEIEANR